MIGMVASRAEGPQTFRKVKIMSETVKDQKIDEALFPWYVTGTTAIVCAVVLLVLALAGPLGTGALQYRSSQSAIWQVEGNDITNLVFMVPILLIGGALTLARRESAKYFLILAPITLMYYGLSVGIGQEWGNPAITGNVEHYFWLFLILIIGGLVLLVSSLSMFTERDTPQFRTKSLRLFVGLTALFLVLFAGMWIAQTAQVIDTGNLADGSYAAAPTSFWVIRFLDLGVTIPVGFMALFLLLYKPQKAYRLVLLFFGFFVTTSTAVNAMGFTMLAHNDPAAQSMGAGMGVFVVLGVLSYCLLYYMVKDKLRTRRSRRAIRTTEGA